MNFEKSIQELEQIVEKLNDKDIAIEVFSRLNPEKMMFHRKNCSDLRMYWILRWKPWLRGTK